MREALYAYSFKTELFIFRTRLTLKETFRFAGTAAQVGLRYTY